MRIKFVKLLTLLFVIALFGACKAKSCDTDTNVNEKKKMKTSGSLFSKKERKRMKR
ncbi:MAG: hypothetical protein HQ463_06145 [Bacteroidetes bacterium]|nr:hypothetical protein [Bacteroidota bacterium]